REKGFFSEAGLDVDLIPPADPAAPPRLVAAKQADIAIGYQPNLYLSHDEGLPLVRFGTLVETPLNTVTVLADGPIKSLKDLKGKKVGFSVA
ncbi:ABC transporter substrate-binding protein, partial [Escherichia coli]|nr:ABC transporter substrate-binding protein [Escherichia coli]